MTGAIVMLEKTDGRFSDAELTQLRREFENHRTETNARWGQLASMVEENTRVTARLALNVERNARSTEGVVTLYRDVRGAARLGTGLQHFLMWVAKWGLIGAAIVHAVTWVLGRFHA